MSAPQSGKPPSPPPSSAATDDGRRGFFGKAAAVVVGGLVAVCPALAGIAMFVDPLRRKSVRSEFLRVATLDALPEDGTPRRFPVIAVRQDAWNRYPPAPIGAVFMRRVSTPEKLEVFNVICPHLGCSVSFNGGREIFQCPCHTSSFALDGVVMSGPSPRGLDTLPFEIRESGGVAEVWIQFENFYTGRSEKDVKA